MQLARDHGPMQEIRFAEHSEPKENAMASPVTVIGRTKPPPQLPEPNTAWNEVTDASENLWQRAPDPEAQLLVEDLFSTPTEAKPELQSRTAIQLNSICELI